MLYAKEEMIQRLIVKLTVIGLLSAFVADLLLAQTLAQTAFSGGTGLYTAAESPPLSFNVATAFGLFCILFAGVLAFAVGDFRRIQKKYLVAFCLMQCWMLLHAINTFWDGFTPFELFGFKGPAVWWGCFAIFIGSDERRWKYLTRLIVTLCYALSLIILVVIVSTGFNDRYEAMRSLYGYVPIVFWTAPWILLSFSARKRGYLVYFPFLIMIFTSFLIVTRSWMIICVLYIGCAFYVKDEKSHSNRNIFGILLAILLIVIGATYFNEKISAAIDLVNSRGLEDTRSEQYQYFLNQISVWDMILGKGPRGSYRLGRSDYGGVDGSFTLMAFNGGVILLVTYSMIMIMPAIKVLLAKPTIELKATSIVLLFWALALSGFSIYSMPDVSGAHYILCLYTGRCLGYLNSMKNDADAVLLPN